MVAWMALVGAAGTPAAATGASVRALRSIGRAVRETRILVFIRGDLPSVCAVVSLLGPGREVWKGLYIGRSVSFVDDHTVSLGGVLAQEKPAKQPAKLQAKR